MYLEEQAKIQKSRVRIVQYAYCYINFLFVWIVIICFTWIWNSKYRAKFKNCRRSPANPFISRTKNVTKDIAGIVLKCNECAHALCWCELSMFVSLTHDDHFNCLHLIRNSRMKKVLLVGQWSIERFQPKINDEKTTLGYFLLICVVLKMCDGMNAIETNVCHFKRKNCLLLVPLWQSHTLPSSSSRFCRITRDKNSNKLLSYQ